MSRWPTGSSERDPVRLTPEVWVLELNYSKITVLRRFSCVLFCFFLFNKESFVWTLLQIEFNHFHFPFSESLNYLRCIFQASINETCVWTALSPDDRLPPVTQAASCGEQRSGWSGWDGGRCTWRNRETYSASLPRRNQHSCIIRR